MKKLFTALLITTLLQFNTSASAEKFDTLFDFADKDRWIIRTRIIDVDPDEQSTVTGLSADIGVGLGFAPELDFTYFLTENIGAELILATINHDAKANNGTDLGETWIIPPTLNLQYHFNPEGQWRPYAGAGLGYIIYYNEDPGAVSSIKYEDGISYSLQAGMDYELDEHWAINADVKHLFHETDVAVNGGAIAADVDLDPWIFGVGLAYRF